MKIANLDFKIVNDVQQYMSSSLPHGPWVHHATITRRDREYIVFRQEQTNKLYIEKVMQHRATLVLEQIIDPQEFDDILKFAEAAGLLNAAGEVKAAI